MEQYDNNVQTVMDFLRAENYSASVISLHRLCYAGFRNYLLEYGLQYSAGKANEWLERNRTVWSYRKYTGWKHCLKQLDDVYLYGAVSSAHLGIHVSPYLLLSPGLKKEMDEFLEQGDINPSDSRYRIACSRFLFYLQQKGIGSIAQLDYDSLFCFHSDDWHRSSRSKDVYEDLIRIFLRHHSSKGRCSIGHSFALNRMLMPQIIKAGPAIQKKSPAEQFYPVTWPDIENFLDGMKNAGYGSSVMKYSRHILKLLYIFMDMHRLQLSEDMLWAWFRQVKPLLHSNWKQARRSLSQFWFYIINGSITTDFTGDASQRPSIDQLPEWIKELLKDYLGLLKREGWQKSTVAMHKSANVRFCQYLQRIGISGIREITPELLQDFNKQDEHSSPEGKAAYNCRIRRFLIYLNDQGHVSNPFLHRALPSASAPSARIITVLSDKEVRDIWSVDVGRLSPKELRDYAIVCIGLTMGFRASDIVSVRFRDINWNLHSISIIQQKTGKAISMPMPVRTGNILFRYLRDARPESSSPYIFIRHKTPYGKLGCGACRRALLCILPDRESAGKGFHVVRKTFATNLLRGNTKVELISGSLGHSTDSTVHKYLSLDEERMRLCPLSLKENGISWKGGAFNA